MPKGKRGDHLPLDPQEDFENPTTEPGSIAEEQVGKDNVIEMEQLPLEGVPQPDEPKVIRDGKMLCSFVKPHFEKEEDGDRYVGFEFSFPLTPAHEESGHLPAEVMREWDHMKNGNSSVTVVRFGISEPQTVAIGLVPGDATNDLILVAAAIENPTLAYVNESGSGKRNKVIRFSFRAVVDQNETIARFAVDHHGDDVWISLQRTQGSLL
jgi:hypothetical protein